MSMRDPPDGDGWNEDPSNEDPSGSIGIHRMRMAHDGHDGWAWDGMGKWRSAFTGNIWMGWGWMGMGCICLHIWLVWADHVGWMGWDGDGIKKAHAINMGLCGFLFIGCRICSQ